MSAICPAGPPNDRMPIFPHTRSASAKLGVGTPVTSIGLAATASVMTTSPRLLGRRPVVRLLGGIPAPPIECIVKTHGMLELHKIILEHARISKGSGQQTGGLGLQ